MLLMFIKQTKQTKYLAEKPIWSNSNESALDNKGQLFP